MKNILLIIFSLFIFTGVVKADDKEAVKKAFNDYKAAITAKDGEKALTYVDKNTKDFYNNVYQSALYADSSTLVKKGLMEKLTVLMLRNQLDKEEFLEMDAKGLFKYAIQNGMEGNGYEQMEVSRVEMNGDHADLYLTVQGMEIPSAFKVRKEEGKWKIDLTSIFGMAEQSINQAIAASGMTENDLIMMTLQQMGGDADKNVWQPLVRK